MGLEIHLLGTPRIERDGIPQPPPRGRKGWALLAYLLRSERPVSRQQLASLLFADADDPLGALRWNLVQLRRLLGGTDMLKGELPALDLPAGTFVDIRVLTTGTWIETADVPGIGRDLLEGMDFPSSPSFEAWLLNERRHLRATSGAVLREAALARLGAGDTENAIGVAARLVALDPLDENYQGLLIRCYASAGDEAAAARQLAACIDLFRRELGIEPGPVVTSAIHISKVSTTQRAAGGAAAARAQLEAGLAAMKAGVVAAGLECLRTATTEAHMCGDIPLKMETLFAMGSTLAHNGREFHEEGAAALHEVIALSERTGDDSLRASACRELAWIELISARFDRTKVWLEQATSLAGDDDIERAKILCVSGMYLTEVGRYGQSIAKLEEAIELAERSGEVQIVAWISSILGRALFLMRDLDGARSASRRAIDIARGAGWTGLVPWPETYLAETELVAGDLEAAGEIAEHSFALATQVGDTCFQSKAERVIGMVEAARGRGDVAIERLEEARLRLVRHPDSTWLMGYILDGLCTIAVERRHPGAQGWINDLENLAGRTGMRELLARAYLHRYSRGDDLALETAGLIARDIDNPYLHEVIAGATRAVAVTG
ncbi:MAG: BTAD domain-containing putative transcriptional regulator [Actinomycetota bacterium]